jgi:O-antigen/teichoic acid export membrane protein
MLTIFTIPKPFTGAIATAQDNSIRSWRALDPSLQIILFGDEPGIAEAAARHGAEHVSDVRRNEHGTPLLDHAFAEAQRRARHARVCYVNADIVFLPDLPAALALLTLPRFLVVGRRLDLDVPKAIDFSDESWAAKLEARARRHGRLHEATGMDYFIFPRGQLARMPPFPVGRALWDNWMVHNARRERIPVIDATGGIAIIHQNHDYGHVRGGQQAAFVGAEVQRNWEILGPDFFPLTIDDATFLLDARGLRPARDARHVLRRIAVWPTLSPPIRPTVRVARWLRRLGVNSSVYFFATIITQALQFFLVPLYTRYLSPGDYGVLTVAGTTIALTTLLLGAFLAGAVGRGYFNAKSKDELRRLVGTVTVLLLLPVPLLIGLDLLGLHGHLEIFAAVPYRPYLRMSLWTGFLSAFVTIITAVYTAAQQPVRATVLTTLSTILIIVLSLVLVVGLRRGAAGNLEAQLIASALVALVSITLLVRRSRLSFSRGVAKEALTYSLPFIPHLVANWAINLSDRYLLQSRVSLSELGFYSLACQLGAVAMSAIGAVNNALGPLLLQQLQEQRQGHVRLLGTYGLLVMTFCCLGTAMLGGEAIRLLTPTTFHSAASLVPWIAGAYQCQAVYFVWSTGTWHSMRTAAVPICTLAAAVTNIGLNLVFVPRYGILAAAVTTLIAYAVLMFAHGWLAQTLYRIDWEYRRWVAMVAAAVACLVAGQLLAPHALGLAILVKSVILLAGFPGILLVTRFVRREEWHELRTIVAALRKR